jgi:hypothetical protein
MLEKISEIGSMIVQMTGHGHTTIRRSIVAGEETDEAKKAKEERAIQETKNVQQVPQTYIVKGKVIDKRWREIPMVYNSQGQLKDPRYGEQIDIISSPEQFLTD